MPKKIKILIADDHAVFRHGLKDILMKHLPVGVIGEAETGDDVLEKIRQTAWNLAVLDVTMPGKNGIEVLREIKQIRPALPILMLSMHPEEQYALRLVQAGAAGYITKIRAPVEIVIAIRTVLAGSQYISPRLAAQLAAKPDSRAEKLPHERLSNRERQVMLQTLSGQPLKEIAGALSVSVQTVSTHRTRALKKLGLQNTAGLIRYALENHLTD